MDQWNVMYINNTFNVTDLRSMDASAHLELAVVATLIASACICYYAAWTLVSLAVLCYGKWWLHSKSSLASLHSCKECGSKNGHNVHGEFGKQEYCIPGVSVLKPIVGCDPNLKQNLESFFKLDYPVAKYELLFCIAESSNAPSLPLVQSLMDKYPHVEARIFQGAEVVGYNPKINNIFLAYKMAKYGLVWICDDKIYTVSNTLTEMVSHLTPQVALVHQLPFFTTNSSSRHTLEDYMHFMHFGTHISRMYLLGNMIGDNCAVGMSWLLRKTALEEVGGLSAFKDVLAEDFYMGKALWKNYRLLSYSGWKMVLSTLPALQNPAMKSLSLFNTRLVRWVRLRVHMMPIPALLEPFTECLGLGVLGALSFSHMFGCHVVLFLILHTTLWFCLDMLQLRITKNTPIGPVWILFSSWLLRELWACPLYAAGLCGKEVQWKDAHYRLSFGGKAIKIK